jgi:hypothetical protein
MVHFGLRTTAPNPNPHYHYSEQHRHNNPVITTLSKNAATTHFTTTLSNRAIRTPVKTTANSTTTLNHFTIEVTGESVSIIVNHRTPPIQRDQTEDHELHTYEPPNSGNSNM